jgi:hypothetical protein
MAKWEQGIVAAMTIELRAISFGCSHLTSFKIVKLNYMALPYGFTSFMPIDYL